MYICKWLQLWLLGEPTDQWMSHCARWAHWPVNVSLCLVSLLTSKCLTLPGEPTDQWMSHLAWWANWPVNVSLCLVSLLTTIAYSAIITLQSTPSPRSPNISGSWPLWSIMLIKASCYAITVEAGLLVARWSYHTLVTSGKADKGWWS